MQNISQGQKFNAMSANGVSQVPIVDISPFTTGGDLSTRQEAAKQLAEKIHLNGSAGISGHGVSSDVLHEAFAIAKKLSTFLTRIK
jgi:isopenicillin N synthase-like dioxygenase